MTWDNNQPLRRRPGLAPTILITGFFGLFGLIPAIRAARRSRALGFPGKDYWVAFALSMLPALALHSAVAALVVVLVMPQLGTPVTGTRTGQGQSGQGQSGQGEAGQDQARGREGGDATVAGCLPLQPLIPGDTAEACGEQVLSATTARLFRYQTGTGEALPDIAESVTTTDNQNFTVELRPGYRFSDGTEVKSRNFVDAWNLMVERELMGSYTLSFVEGYAPAAPTMSGLTVIDDHTFTIRTSEPIPDLPIRLGSIQLAPLPDSYFADESGYEVQPVGAGPFRVLSKNSREIVLERSEHYSGPTPAHLDRVTIRMILDPEAGYQALVNGEVQIAALPPSQQGSGRAEVDNAGRLANPPRGVVSVLVVSPADPQLANNARLRQALSMAIDRESVMKAALMAGIPATGWVPPGMPGGGSDACGPACTLDRERAKALYNDAGGYEGTLALTVNADGNHRVWAQAVCASINAGLGTDCQVQVEPDFRTFMDKATKGELPGLYRSGWQMDAPSAGNFLAPVYGSGQVSNWAQYANPEFDALIREASVTDPDESLRLYGEAERLLGRDLPSLPLWYSTTPTVWSDQVTQVHFDPWGRVDYTQLQRA